MTTSKLPPPGKDPADWTADEIVAVLPHMLGDARAVDGCLRLLLVLDPHRAQRLLDTIELGLELRGKIMKGEPLHAIERGKPGVDCVRESVTPTEDGRLIVDCSEHGEIGSVGGGGLNRVSDGEYERVVALWEKHLREQEGAPGEPEPAAATGMSVDQAARSLRTRLENIDNEYERDVLNTVLARLAELEKLNRILRHYLVKTAGVVGRPTADPLTEPPAVEHVGEGVLRALERLRAMEQRASP